MSLKTSKTLFSMSRLIVISIYLKKLPINFVILFSCNWSQTFMQRDSPIFALINSPNDSKPIFNLRSSRTFIFRISTFCQPSRKSCPRFGKRQHHVDFRRKTNLNSKRIYLSFCTNDVQQKTTSRNYSIPFLLTLFPSNFFSFL